MTTAVRGPGRASRAAAAAVLAVVGLSSSASAAPGAVTFGVGRGPVAVAVDEQRHLLYVLNATDGAIAVLSDGGAPVRTVKTTAAGSALVYSPSNGALYVSDYRSGTVQKLDPTTGAVTATTTPGGRLYSLAASEKHQRLYATDSAGGVLRTVDLRTLSAVSTVQVGPMPYGVAVDDRNDRVYVAVRGSDEVATIDATNGAVLATTPVRSAPVDIAASPGLGRAFAVSATTGTVSVIDTAGALVGAFELGSPAYAIGVSDRAGSIVTAGIDGTARQADARSGTPGRTARVGANPVAVTVDSAGTAYLPDRDNGTVTRFDLNGAGTDQCPPVLRTDPSSGAATTPLVANGSFEEPLVAEATEYETFTAAGPCPLPGWRILAGSLDLAGPRAARARAGVQFVDLNGNDAAGPGTIAQEVAAIPGHRYRMAFSLAGNPKGDPAVKSIRVSLGADTRTLDFDVTGHDNDELGWAPHTVQTTVACGGKPSLHLEFASLTAGERGPNLDDVVLTDLDAAPVVRPVPDGCDCS